MSTLKQYNICPENGNIPESPCVSEKHAQWDEESLHSFILDSPNICDSLETFHDDHRTMMNKTKPNLVSDDTDEYTSPLLNPNAIHNRRSLIILNIEEILNNDEQENKAFKLNRKKQYASTTIDLVPPATLSSTLNMLVTTPLVHILSPCFARHQRRVKVGALGAGTSGDEKETSSSGQLPKSLPYATYT